MEALNYKETNRESVKIDKKEEEESRSTKNTKMAALNTDSQILIFKTHIIIYLNLSNIRNNLIN